MGLKEAVGVGVTEIVRAYPDTRHVADGQGGAWIEIPEVEVGELYARSTSLLICLLPFHASGSRRLPDLLRPHTHPNGRIRTRRGFRSH